MKYPLVKLEDICFMGSGGTPSRSKMELYYGGNIPWVKSGELKENAIFSTEETITEAGLNESSAKMVLRGSILIAMYGATVGRLAILGIDAATNQAVCHLRPKSSKIADLSFLFRVLQTKVPEWLAARVGGAQPNISQTIIRNTKISLPPLPEQKRIAAILDKADAIRRKREKAIELTDSFLRSVFLEMFGDPRRNPMNWNFRALADIAETRLGKMLDGKKQTGLNPRPYLRNTNVKWGYFDLGEVYQMDFDESDREEFALSEGDVLICEGGEVGRCAVWQEKQLEMYFQKALHRVRTDSRYVLPEYLAYFMRILAEQGGLVAHTSSATIAHLTGVKLKQLPIMLPPLEKQQRFVTLAAQLRELDLRMSQSLKKIDTLIANLARELFSKKSMLSCQPSGGKSTREPHAAYSDVSGHLF